MYRKKACFSQPEQQQEVFPFCKNVNETVWFLRKTMLKQKSQGLFNYFPVITLKFLIDN